MMKMKYGMAFSPDKFKNPLDNSPIEIFLNNPGKYNNDKVLNNLTREEMVDIIKELLKRLNK